MFFILNLVGERLECGDLVVHTGMERGGMPKRLNRNKFSSGFTIVELLIVIVVIAILAAISIVAYNGIRARSIDTLLSSDLRSVQKHMEASRAVDGQYPSALPPSSSVSTGVTLTLMPGGSGGTEVYTGLTAAQNGVLFYDVCQKLLAEGVGSKPDDGRHYVSACTVSSYNQLHVNGWNGRNINVPITTTSLANYVNSYSGGSVAEFKTKGQAFMDEWSTRFQAMGGSFPVTEFWDSWATATNGGRVKPSLPAPTVSGGDPSQYCIQATYGDSVRHIRQNGDSASGAC